MCVCVYIYIYFIFKNPEFVPTVYLGVACTCHSKWRYLFKHYLITLNAGGEKCL